MSEKLTLALAKVQVASAKNANSANFGNATETLLQHIQTYLDTIESESDALPAINPEHLEQINKMTGLFLSGTYKPNDPIEIVTSQLDNGFYEQTIAYRNSEWVEKFSFRPDGVERNGIRCYFATKPSVFAWLGNYKAEGEAAALSYVFIDMKELGCIRYQINGDKVEAHIPTMQGGYAHHTFKKLDQ